MTNLTNDDLNILLQAVRLWEKEPSQEGAMASIFTSMIDSLDPDVKSLTHQERTERSERKRREEKNKVDALLELRRETSILLQAKLIAARS